MQTRLVYYTQLDCGKLGSLEAKVLYDWFPIDQEVRIRQIEIPALYLSDIIMHLSRESLKEIVCDIQEVNIGG